MGSGSSRLELLTDAKDIKVLTEELERMCHKFLWPVHGTEMNFCMAPKGGGGYPLTADLAARLAACTVSASTLSGTAGHGNVFVDPREGGSVLVMPSAREGVDGTIEFRALHHLIESGRARKTRDATVYDAYVRGNPVGQTFTQEDVYFGGVTNRHKMVTSKTIDYAETLFHSALFNPVNAFVNAGHMSLFHSKVHLNTEILLMYLINDNKRAMGGTGNLDADTFEDKDNTKKKLLGVHKERGVIFPLKPRFITNKSMRVLLDASRKTQGSGRSQDAHDITKALLAEIQKLNADEVIGFSHEDVVEKFDPAKGKRIKLAAEGAPADMKFDSWITTIENIVRAYEEELAASTAERSVLRVQRMTGWSGDRQLLSVSRAARSLAHIQGGKFAPSKIWRAAAQLPVRVSGLGQVRQLFPVPVFPGLLAIAPSDAGSVRNAVSFVRRALATGMPSAVNFAVGDGLIGTSYRGPYDTVLDPAVAAAHLPRFVSWAVLRRCAPGESPRTDEIIATVARACDKVFRFCRERKRVVVDDRKHRRVMTNLLCHALLVGSLAEDAAFARALKSGLKRELGAERARIASLIVPRMRRGDAHRIRDIMADASPQDARVLVMLRTVYSVTSDAQALFSGAAGALCTLFDDLAAKRLVAAKRDMVRTLAAEETFDAVPDESMPGVLVGWQETMIELMRCHRCDLLLASLDVSIRDSLFPRGKAQSAMALEQLAEIASANASIALH